MLFGRLALADTARKDDVAEHQLGTGAVGLCQFGRLREWEGQDVGRLVLAPPLGIERADVLVAGQADRNLDRPRSGSELRKGAFGKGRLGGAANEQRPVGATVPLLVGFDVDLEHHARIRPRPLIGFDDAPD